MEFSIIAFCLPPLLLCVTGRLVPFCPVPKLSRWPTPVTQHALTCPLILHGRGMGKIKSSEIPMSLLWSTKHHKHHTRPPPPTWPVSNRLCCMFDHVTVIRRGKRQGWPTRVTAELSNSMETRRWLPPSLPAPSGDSRKGPKTLSPVYLRFQHTKLHKAAAQVAQPQDSQTIECLPGGCFVVSSRQKTMQHRILFFD